jgi:hypothetical protein
MSSHPRPLIFFSLLLDFCGTDRRFLRQFNIRHCFVRGQRFLGNVPLFSRRFSLGRAFVVELLTNDFVGVW